MSFDSDPIDLADRKIYSYATIADTFFWGEKRKFLANFQSSTHTIINHGQNKIQPHLKIVTLAHLEDK